MIKITILKGSGDKYKGFSVLGHAGYDVYGKDIICASVSVLTVNTINAIETFTDDGFKVEQDETLGSLKFKFQDTVSEESKLLIDTMVLGLRSIEEGYGSKYIKVLFKEV